MYPMISDWRPVQARALVLGLLLLSACDSPRSDGRATSGAEGPVTVDADEFEILRTNMDADSLSALVWQAVAILPRGDSVSVVSRGNAHVVTLDGEGRVAGTWGRSGEGPGEFVGRISEVFPCADGMVVRQNTVLDVYSLDGSFRSRSGVYELLDGWAWSDLIGVRPDCSGMLVAKHESGEGRASGEVFRGNSAVLWLSLEGEGTDSVGVFPGPERLAVQRPGGATSPVSFAFGVEPRWAIHPEGLLYMPNDAYELQVLDASGATLRTITWSGPSREIPDARWDEYFARRDEVVAEEPREALMIPDRSSHPRPATAPVASSIRVDAVGRIWVEVYRGPGLLPDPDREEWWVLDIDGSWLGRFIAPPRFEWMNADADQAWGIGRDEFDREFPARVAIPY